MKLNQFMHLYLISRSPRENLAKITKTEMVAYLLAAKAKISTPATWTQATDAMDAKGASVAANSAEAVKFCSIGAIRNKMNGGEAHYTTAVFRKAATIVVPSEEFKISTFNDSHTHKEVMALWDAVISKIESLED